MAELGSLPSFDPTIPMGIKIPPPAAQQNPLELITEVAGAQKALVDAQSARAVLAAHTKAGQIIAAAPSLDEGLKGILADPETAGFAQDIVQSLASTKQTLDVAAGLEQTQNQSAIEFLFKNLAANVTNPAGVPDSIAGSMAALPPEIRQRNGLAITSYVKSLTDGLPPDPAAAAVEFQKRLAATSTAIGGVTPDKIFAQTGNIPSSIALQPVGPGGSSVFVQQGGPMAGPQAAPHEAGTESGAAAPNSGAALLQGPTAEELAAMSGKGQNAATIQADMSADAAELPVLAKRLNIMGDTLHEFQAGGGADSRAAIAKLMQGLKNMGVDGITDKMIQEVGNSSLSATQLFESEVKPYVISELKSSAQGTGRVMRSEVDAFLQSMDDTNDPAMLVARLDQGKYLLRLGNDRAVRYLDFKKDLKKLGVEEGDYYVWYNLHHGDEKSLPDVTGGGIDIGNTKPGVKGIGGGKPSLDEIFGGG